jgi:hypothetical protein
MDDFSDLSEEEIQQLIDLGIIDDETGMLDKQMKYAQSMRNAPGPEMRGNGRVMVAGNPLEFAAQAWQGIRSGNEIKDIKARQEELLRKQSAGRQTFLKGLRGKNQQMQQDPYAGYGPQPYDPEEIL